MRRLMVFTALIFAGSYESRAQGPQDLNLSNRLEMLQPSIAKSLELNTISGPGVPGDSKEKQAHLKIVCDPTKRNVAALSSEVLAQMIHADLIPNTAHLKRSDEKATARLLQTDTSALNEARAKAAVIVIPPDLCAKQQPTKVKLTVGFNPQYETNVLKSPSNIHEDHTTGVTSQLLVATGGLRDFDIMAFSVGTASSRYDKFHNKSVDAMSIQGIYQFFLGAVGYKDGRPFPIGENTPKADILPGGLVTFDTLSFAIQNQAAYTPTFRTRTVDLLTPQIQLTRSNISLLGANPANECSTAQDAYKQHVFCYFADAYLNVAHTYSDVKAQENTNVAASVTLGRRIDKTNWKLTMQTTLTEKWYDNVVGGRRDLTLQTGPTLSYSHPAFATPLGSVSLGFNLPITYWSNQSTLAAAEWHGWVIMPTLTLAYAPR
jgi:hypothetical protein